MKKIILWVTVAILCYIAALVILLPANYAYTKIVPVIGMDQSRDLTLNGISGTLWSGKAEELHYRKYLIGQLEWDISVLSLLLGELGSSWKIDRGDDTLEGGVTVGDSGLFTFDELEGKLAPSSLLPLLPFAPFGVKGTLLVNMQQLQLKNNRPLQVIGTASWQQAELIIGDSIDMGTILMQFETDPKSGDITINITNEEGVVAVQATAELSANGQYRVNGQIHPRLSRDANLLKILVILGTPDQKGVLHFSYSGTI